MLLEQGTTLTFGHAAPDPELDTVVEGVGTAFGDHRAVPADDRGFALSGTADEELVRIGAPAPSLRHPRDAGLCLCSLD